MKDSLNLAPTPLGEECAQLGDMDYSSRSRKECTAFINQLKREFGEPALGAAVKSFVPILPGRVDLLYLH